MICTLEKNSRQGDWFNPQKFDTDWHDWDYKQEGEFLILKCVTCGLQKSKEDY